MSARDELESLIRDHHGEFCMSMSCDCSAAAKAEADDLYDRIRNEG